MPDINWVTVTVAALSSFGLGAVWYGPLFGRAWMRVADVTEEQVREGNPAAIYAGAFLLQLLAAAVLAMFIGTEMAFGPALAAAGSVGVFWVAPAFGVVYLFERRPVGHLVVNAGYYIVAFLIMGAIIAGWR